jgi:hypothetical protein
VLFDHAEHAQEVDEDLRLELLRRRERDQAVRLSLEPNWDEWAAVDADNLAWFRQVVTERGWPDRSMVGDDGAHVAWLLAQHADADPLFQQRCLDLLIDAARRGEAFAGDVAYLTDRVLLAQGQPQEYGTQVTGYNGVWAARKLRDPEWVDARRARASLGPLSDYLASFAEQGPPEATSFACRQCGAIIAFWLPEPGEDLELTCPTCGWVTRTTVTGGPPG